MKASDMSWQWRGRTSLSLNNKNMVSSTCCSSSGASEWGQNGDWSDVVNVVVGARQSSGVFHKPSTRTFLGTFFLVPKRENSLVVVRGPRSAWIEWLEAVDWPRSSQGPPTGFEWMNPASNEWELLSYHQPSVRMLGQQTQRHCCCDVW